MGDAGKDFSKAIHALVKLYKGEVPDQERASFWDDLYFIVSVENIKSILEICGNGCQCEAPPTSAWDAVTRLPVVIKAGDRSGLSNGLCALSALAANPHNALVWRIWESDQVSGCKDVEEKQSMMDNWGKGLRLLTHILESLNVVRGGGDEGTSSWIGVLANEIFSAAWKLHIPAVLYALRSLQSLGWDAGSIGHAMRNQVKNFERPDFEIAVFGVLLGLTASAKQDSEVLPGGSCGNKRLPWVLCLLVLYDNVINLEQGDRMATFQSMSQHVLQYLQDNPWALQLLMKSLKDHATVPCSSPLWTDGRRGTHVWLLAALLPCVHEANLVIEMDDLLLEALSEVREDCSLQECLCELEKSQGNLFSLITSQMIKWVTCSSNPYAKTGESIILWLAETASNPVAIIKDFTSSLKQDLTEANLRQCIGMLWSILDTLERDCPPDDPLSSSYTRSSLLDILQSIVSLISDLLMHIPNDLQSPLCKCVARLSVWDDAYPAVLLETVHSLLTNGDGEKEVLVNLICDLLEMDLSGKLSDPGEEYKSQVVAVLSKILGDLDYDCKNLLYGKFANCLSNGFEDAQQDEAVEIPDKEVSLGSLWFVNCVGDAIKKIMMGVFRMGKRGIFSVQSLVGVRKTSEYQQVSVIEPLHLLCKVVVRLEFGDWKRDRRFSRQEENGSHHQDRERKVEGVIGRHALNYVVELMRCICSKQFVDMVAFDGLNSKQQVPCSILMACESMAMIQMFISEVISCRGIQECEELTGRKFWEKISRLKGVAGILGSLLYAHGRLWAFIAAQYECWRLSFRRRRGISEVLWTNVEDDLLRSITGSGKTLAHVVLRAVVCGHLVPFGRCCLVNCEETSQLVTIIDDATKEKEGEWRKLLSNVQLLASLSCALEQSKWKTISVILEGCLLLRRRLPHSVSGTQLSQSSTLKTAMPESSHGVNFFTPGCSIAEENESGSHMQWNSGIEQLPDSHNILREHDNVFLIAARGVELALREGPENFAEINCIVALILPNQDLHKMMERARSTDGWECMGLTQSLNPACSSPLLAALLRIVMDLYDVLTVSRKAAPLAAHVVSGALSLACLLREPGVKQARNAQFTEEQAQIPVSCAAHALTALLLRNCSSGRIDSGMCLHLLPAALELMSSTMAMSFVSTVLLDFVGAPMGLPWWCNTVHVHLRGGPLFTCPRLTRLRILDMLLDFLDALEAQPILDAATSGLYPLLDMCFITCAFCITRLSSWILHVADGDPEKECFKQNLLSQLKENNFLKTAVLVVKCWADRTTSTLTPSLHTSTDINLVGSCLAIESNQLFTDLGIDPIDPYLLESLCDSKHGEEEGSMVGGLLSCKPPAWIAVAIRGNNSSEGNWTPEVIEIDVEPVEVPHSSQSERPASSPAQNEEAGMTWAFEELLPDSPLSLGERFDSPERGILVQAFSPPKTQTIKKKRKEVSNPYIKAVLEQEKEAGCQKSQDTFSDLEDFIVPSKKRDYKKVLKKRFFMPKIKIDHESEAEDNS